MVSTWQAGVNYGINDVVKHNGKSFKIRQPHTSQSDWEPQMTPALWSVVPEEYQQSQPQQGYQNQPQQGYQQQPQQGQQQGYQGQNQPQQGYQTQPGYNQVPSQPSQQKPNDSDDDSKNFFEKIGSKVNRGVSKLGTGGTIAAGVGLATVVGGGIALAVNSKKEKKLDKL